MSFRQIAKISKPDVPCIGVTLLIVMGSVFANDSAEPQLTAPSDTELEFFEAKIRPVLVEKCYSCHSSEAEILKGGLHLDSREGLLTGGDSGAAAIPQNPAESLLIQSLKYESFEMPPSGKLPDAVIADFERWVEMGMPDPRVSGKPISVQRAPNVEAGRQFWSFQPVRMQEPPAVQDETWPLGEIDHFLLAKLEEHSLSPAADAERAVWLRRITFDLIGLPPTLEEIDAFVTDPSAQAYETVIDRLFASPHFGERWGRRWLDIARFAESSGGGRSMVFKDAWRYRDYVIDAVNRDKPVDEFIIEQIAGDLLPHATPAEEHDHLVATAYLMLGAHNYEEQDKKVLEMDVVDEQLETIGRGLLGMTISCARCHDHKFDPIPTADYYAMAGILRSTQVLVHENVSKWTTRTLPMSEADKSAVQEYKAIIKEKEQIVAKANKRESGADKKEILALKKELAELKKSGPPGPTAMAVKESDRIEDCRLCIRGSIRNRGPAVPRGFMQVATVGTPPKISDKQSGRLELAHWITSSQNPLTARVYVNRVWNYLMGAGLVRTVDNFGVAGEAPSHPELLDYLAGVFVVEGWSTKQLIRQIVTSHAYRMSTVANDSAMAIDPENRLLWRMNRKRLDAESLRDAMLVASGKLDTTIGGPNILDSDVINKSGGDRSTEYNYVFADSRRSIYTPAFRNKMHELFEVFDFADQNGVVAQRNVTTAAPQALLMLNSPFVMEQARAAAQRALAKTDETDQQRIERAFREILGRRPTVEEADIAIAAVLTQVVNDSKQEGGDNRVASWELLFQGLFGCVDFRYLD